MRIDVLTLFPEVIQPYLSASILGRAQSASLIEFHLHQLRDYTTDSHKKVDDRPFGGGPGMILSCQPIVDAVFAIEKLDTRRALRILMTPQGRLFDQACASDFALAEERLLIICGHYEGIDERVIELLNPLELSVGDYVLTGGELPALTVCDAVARLLPGVLGNDAATARETFTENTLEFPHYTRPREFRGLSVPDVLLSGNHAEIEAWRAAQSRQRTIQRRPDLDANQYSIPPRQQEPRGAFPSRSPASVMV
ncbi:MAG: tRNA (guanosine(37)-N1)-methyltransferase TrmD [Phycisphaerae bacterium]